MNQIGKLEQMIVLNAFESNDSDASEHVQKDIFQINLDNPNQTNFST